MIEIRDISKSFGEQHVLKQVSAVFESGKTNLVIGISGSGKTVLMKIMTGLITPDAGKVFFNDRDYYDLSRSEQKLLRREIGMLFQGSALFDSLTVEENVMLPLNMFSNDTQKERLDRVNFCLDRVNLAGANKKYPGELSGGMKKRVGIARAIVLNPRYLFCDEPNSGLDPRTSIVIDDLIIEITKEYNMTTIINTHDMNSVMEIGEKIVFLYKGVKDWEGNKDEILQAKDENLNSFIFASDFLRDARDALKEKKGLL
ncbi:MAG TPA: ATP-binding cassette domain-containing protein [Chitinophagales bacterium]|nr:ATP-binding cassette domain-containing protein [Chitinophagales bacterium]HMU68840.1 ATP-binding cassette domain-containing protein [Chitinophagales bacterium]HMX04113.1 ATP-binding cassette domain-containing protein [Chitinophagales bacterium]HMZ89971.1 ATP-binding cassette domain-containing protein [Chitinophagales bacterium]HNA57277.1 ATP-binding cassette domain-containing protein [Chitinophagales bacterium]